MKRLAFFLLIVATFATTFYSCKTNTDDLWDSIHQLDGRVTSLEDLCKQMNGNISSLQKLVQALQDNNSITMVTPIKQGDKTIGYTISFAKGEPITIYHGEKGDKGEQGDKGETGDKGDTGTNGKDGTTPAIGVKQHADGIYYWTLNGDWLRDNSGNMIKAEGKDGADGEQGEEGKAGITPQLKIEDGYWWVSYGDDSNWIQLDKAVVDNGETIFREVTQDDDYVYFTLKDETVITIQKYRKLSITFKEGDDLKFDVDETKVIHYTIKSDGAKNVIKAEMFYNDNCYTLGINKTNSTSGIITIKAGVPTTNQVIVSVSNGEVTIMVGIDVSLKPSLEEETISVVNAGTLATLLKDYDKNSITTLKIIGSLNANDISTLNKLPQLSTLDLENVYLEEMPQDAFNDKTTLTSITLPRTLKKINRRAFEGCMGLRGDLIIPPSVVEIEARAFRECYFGGKLVLPPDLSMLGSSAFDHSYFIGDLIIPSSITKIDNSTFSSAGFTGKLVLPNNLVSIGYSAFNDCNFTGKLILPSSITEIGDYAFANCNTFAGELILPSSITEIGSYAFANCNTFTGNLTIPSSTIMIGSYAFTGCSGFSSLEISSGCEVISESAFEECEGLERVVLPSTINYLNKNTFVGCDKLANVYCNRVIPPVIENNETCFSNYDCLYVPKGSVGFYQGEEGWNKFKSIKDFEFQ